MVLRDGKLAIIALDPGGTTGWALCTADVIHSIGNDHQHTEFYNEKFDAGQIGPGHHHLRLWKLLELWTVMNTIIVCESFEFRRNSKDRSRDNIVLDSKEYIGVVNLYAQHHAETTRGLPPLVVKYQTAAKGKAFWTDEKLKAAGKFATPKSNWTHANDAMRHLLHYMTFEMQRLDLVNQLKGGPPPDYDG